MRPWSKLFATLLLSLSSQAYSQIIEGTKAVPDADSAYIRTFIKRNDIRLFYGGQANRMILGSLRDGSPDLSKNVYNNTNDFIGIGGTYKWLDGDLWISLPGTTYLKEERSNLEQFRLAGSYTRRKVSYRGYLSNSTGVMISGNDDEYESTPSLHEFRIGLQVTYIFNETKYSYRAALYQSEKQMNTAGSFLLRVEPFFRDLGSSEQPMVPQAYDTEERFGEQAGLTYVRAPGCLVMPGYGVNFVLNNSKLFISPLLLAGAGVAVNHYQSDKGKNTHVNMEYNGYFIVNTGYNGSLYYAHAQFKYTASYSPIDPAYLTSTDLSVSVLFGLRLDDIFDRKAGQH